MVSLIVDMYELFLKTHLTQEVEEPLGCKILSHLADCNIEVLILDYAGFRFIVKNCIFDSLESLKQQADHVSSE